MANRRNIILADCEEEEIQEFAAGMQEFFGEAFDVRSYFWKISGNWL